NNLSNRFVNYWRLDRTVLSGSAQSACCSISIFSELVCLVHVSNLNNQTNLLFIAANLTMHYPRADSHCLGSVLWHCWLLKTP
ncbi:hypothetical protein TSAR_005165, partial [Trichomalopsis sarcophagae]